MDVFGNGCKSCSKWFTKRWSSLFVNIFTSYLYTVYPISDSHVPKMAHNCRSKSFITMFLNLLEKVMNSINKQFSNWVKKYWHGLSSMIYEHGSNWFINGYKLLMCWEMFVYWTKWFTKQVSNVVVNMFKRRLIHILHNWL